MREMVGGCCVCSDERGWDENPLVYCDGVGCNVAVHQACYGIVSVPTGPWFCRKCESQERSARVRCELCPSRDGALKRTDTSSWAHVVCALYIPEVRFGNVSTMEPIVLGLVPQDRYIKTCYLCERQGRENRASSGACMQCNRPGCKQSFHVTCAQSQGLLCEEAGNYMDNVKYCGYCEYHYSRINKKVVKTIPAFKPVSSASSPGSSSPEKSDSKTSPSFFGASVAPKKNKKGRYRGSSSSSATSPQNSLSSSTPVTTMSSAYASESNVLTTTSAVSDSVTTTTTMTTTSVPTTTISETTTSSSSSIHETKIDDTSSSSSSNANNNKALSSAKNNAYKKSEPSSKFHESKESSSETDSKKKTEPSVDTSSSVTPVVVKLGKYDTSLKKEGKAHRKSAVEDQHHDHLEKTESVPPLHPPPTKDLSSSNEKSSISETYKSSADVKLDSRVSVRLSSMDKTATTYGSYPALTSSSSRVQLTAVQSTAMETVASSAVVPSSTHASVTLTLTSSSSSSSLHNNVSKAAPISSSNPVTISNPAEEGAGTTLKAIEVKKDSPATIYSKSAVSAASRTDKTHHSNDLISEETEIEPVDEYIFSPEDDAGESSSMRKPPNGGSGKRAGRPPKKGAHLSMNPVTTTLLDNDRPSTADPLPSRSPLSSPELESASSLKKKRKRMENSMTNGMSSSSSSVSAATTAMWMMGTTLNPASNVAKEMGMVLQNEISSHSAFDPSAQKTLKGVPLPGKRSRLHRIPVSDLYSSQPQTLDELLERQWEQGSQFLMDQASHFDIASLLSSLHQLREENVELEDSVERLVQRRDHLLAVRARLLALSANSVSAPVGGNLSQAAEIHRPPQGPPLQQQQQSSIHHNNGPSPSTARVSISPRNSMATVSPVRVTHLPANPSSQLPSPRGSSVSNSVTAAVTNSRELPNARGLPPVPRPIENGVDYHQHHHRSMVGDRLMPAHLLPVSSRPPPTSHVAPPHTSRSTSSHVGVLPPTSSHLVPRSHDHLRYATGYPMGQQPPPSSNSSHHHPSHQPQHMVTLDRSSQHLRNQSHGYMRSMDKR